MGEGETKVILYHRRAESLSVEAWNRFWQGEHLAALCQFSGASRIVQNVPRREPVDPPLDGIDEIYWPTREDAQRAANSAAMAEIASALLHHSAEGWPRGMLAWERMAVARRDAPYGVRRMATVYRHPEISQEQFDYEWEVIHPPLVGALTGMDGYLQSVRIAPIPGLPAPDCGSTLWWRSVDLCLAAYRNEGPAEDAHNGHMARIFSRGQPTGTFCDPIEVPL